MSDLSVFIRAMVVEDIPRVVEIDRLSFALPWPPNSYRFELTQNDASRCWVAVVANSCEHTDDESQDVEVGLGTIVAILVLWLIEDEAHVATVAVHPDYRGLGIGRRIMLEALHDAVAYGATMATLEVRTSNQTAINLYSDLGFEIVGARPHYYQDTNEDALIMTNEYLSKI